MLESLVTDYGYPVIVIGTFLEGETIMILGGLVSHLGYLSLKWVVACGFCGALMGDQFWFFIGRRHGKALLARRPAWQGRVQPVFRRLERHQNLVIAGFRFVYGFRLITPVAIGMSAVPYGRFLTFNIIGTTIWTATIASAGYFFGRAVESVLGDLKRYELAVVGSVVAVSTIVWMVHFYRRRRLSHGAGAQR